MFHRLLYCIQILNSSNWCAEETALEIVCVSPKHWWYIKSVIISTDVPNFWHMRGKKKKIYLFNKIQIVWSTGCIHLFWRIFVLFCFFVYCFFSEEKGVIAHIKLEGTAPASAQRWGWKVTSSSSDFSSSPWGRYCSHQGWKDFVN